MSRLALLSLALALHACGGDAPGPESAVLITLDTTRADAVRFDQPAGPTPQLAALAAESVVYRRARTVAPLTLPAHASMMTGLWPPQHGVRDNGRAPLPQSAVTLAERAREAGLETAAFVAAVVLDAGFGLDQGFDVYDVPAHAPGLGPAQTTAAVARRGGEEVVDAALAWLAGRDPARPFFLWVHLFDPHAPYAPPAGCLERAGGDPYIGEVSAADAAVGRLVSALRERGALDRAVLVVAGDHGESRGEHGEPTHGAYCYEAVMRVPFLVRHPDGTRAGEVSDEIVSVADVGPTLCEALSLAPLDDGAGGVSLLGPVDPGRGVYLESYYGYLNYGWSPLAGWVDARGKYLQSSAPELYDPLCDPAEGTNLAGERPGERERYRAALAGALAAPRLAAGATAERDPAVLESLRQLGYPVAPDTSGDSGSLPGPLEPSDRPSPLSRRGELEIFNGALSLAERGQLDRAILELEGLTAENPENHLALDFLSSWLVARGRCDEARPLLETLVRSGAAGANAHNNLAGCLERAGEPEAALCHYRRARALDPHHVQTLRNLARVLEQAGEREEAASLRAEVERVTGG